MDMRLRRIMGVVLSLVGFVAVILTAMPLMINTTNNSQIPAAVTEPAISAMKTHDTLTIKGRAPKTGYSRSQFGNGWATTNGCDTENIILHRDLQNPVVDEKCVVVSGILAGLYTATMINFIKGNKDVQIDYVVALSDT